MSRTKSGLIYVHFTETVLTASSYCKLILNVKPYRIHIDDDVDVQLMHAYASVFSL